MKKLLSYWLAFRLDIEKKILRHRLRKIMQEGRQEMRQTQYQPGDGLG